MSSVLAAALNAAGGLSISVFFFGLQFPDSGALACHTTSDVWHLTNVTRLLELLQHILLSLAVLFHTSISVLLCLGGCN